MKLNWNFLGKMEGAKQKPSMGGVWIFSGTARSLDCFLLMSWLMGSFDYLS